MKLQILSDLHIDSYVRRGLSPGSIPQSDAQVVILAGDISNSRLGMQWSIEQADKLGKPLIYIAGNHEYFGEDMASFDHELAAMASDTNVIFLQKQTYRDGDVCFMGCTLWTDFCFGLDARHLSCSKLPIFDGWQKQIQIMTYAQDHMRDYMSIDHGARKLTVEDVLQTHHDHLLWLKQALYDAHQAGLIPVVITHHGVSALSVSSKYAGSPGNAAFVSDLSDLMHASDAPKLWIHGHTHDAFDYQLGSTRVVVNPRAYPKEVSSTANQFNWAKIVEI